MAEDRPAWLEEIRALKRSIGVLEGRVRQLEAHSGVAAAPAADPDDSAEEDAIPQAVVAGFAKAPAHVGRLLLVLGGAYLLRALAWNEQVPALAAVGAGLAYGCAWLLLAERAGRRRDGYGAASHGVASAAVIFPLLWETSARLEALSYPVAAALLVTITLVAFGISARHRLPVLATLFACAAGASGIALIVTAGASSIPVGAALVGLGGAGLLLGRRHAMTMPMAASAGVADVAATVLVFGAVRGTGGAPLATIVLLVLLFGLYVGVSAVGTLSARRRLDSFDGWQSGLVLLLGFGGALFVASRTGTHELPLGLGAVVLAIGLYLLAFAVLDRERRRCFQYLTSIAIVLVLSASASLLPRPVLPWVLLAAGTAVTARVFGRVTLAAHACIYALAATLASGAFGSVAGWWTALHGNLPAEPAPWLALGALLVVGAVRATSVRAGSTRVGDATRALVHIALWAVGGGLLLRAAATVLAGGADALGSAAWQAATRTVVLALLVLVSARLGQRKGYGAYRGLALVTLGIGAVKLVFEDLMVGHAVSLALSFSAFGVALILAPRLLRSRSPAA